MALITQALGIDAEKVRDICRDAVEEAKSRKVHAYALM